MALAIIFCLFFNTVYSLWLNFFTYTKVKFFYPKLLSLSFILLKDLYILMVKIFYLSPLYDLLREIAGGLFLLHSFTVKKNLKNFIKSVHLADHFRNTYIDR